MRSLLKKLLNRETKLCVVGLGYVGLPVAAAFSKKIDVIGFDINNKKISEYKEGFFEQDFNLNMSDFGDSIIFTSDETSMEKAEVFIVAVPTPTNHDNTPDLSCVLNACKIIARNMKKGACIIFESTVYPGTTEDICIPMLEACSKLTCGSDFKVGFSPERINPGDDNHQFSNTSKVVSGCDAETLEFISKLYGMVISATVYPAATIKVAEAAKILENIQRDVNIALVNEMAQVFKKMDIDISSVISAASTKWNFHTYNPGLVGGHCIGVDSYYLLHKAKELHCSCKVIEASRETNESVALYCAEALLEKLSLLKKDMAKIKVAFLGLSFKENCSDIRNTKVMNIVSHVKEKKIQTILCDEHVDEVAFEKEYKTKLVKFNDIKSVDAVVVAVAHDEYKKLSAQDLKSLYKSSPYILLDIKGIYSEKQLLDAGFSYWKI